jgi:FlaA1/EpsC-like NDP-sugar epimerase
MTRFFLTLEDAISLLFKAAENSIGGETFVMNMPACYIKDLAEVLMEKQGKVDMTVSGMRPGEKLDEVLVSKHESMLTYNYDQNYYVILPPSAKGALLDKYSNYSKFDHIEFSSKTRLMNKIDIENMLKRGKFL